MISSSEEMINTMGIFGLSFFKFVTSIGHHDGGLTATPGTVSTSENQHWVSSSRWWHNAMESERKRRQQPRFFHRLCDFPRGAKTEFDTPLSASWKHKKARFSLSLSCSSTAISPNCRFIYYNSNRKRRQHPRQVAHRSWIYLRHIQLNPVIGSINNPKFVPNLQKTHVIFSIFFKHLVLTIWWDFFSAKAISLTGNEVATPTRSRLRLPTSAEIVLRKSKNKNSKFRKIYVVRVRFPGHLDRESCIA